MPLHIHAVMEDSDNFNGAGENLAVENNVSSGAVFTVAVPDIATVPALQRFISQVLKTAVQHRQIFITLRPAPFALGVSTDIL